MSDFVNGGWSIYITAVTLLALVACLVLLAVASRRKVIIGPDGDDGSTGHLWDGDLREMNNPLPRWWVGLFILTVIFAGVYLVLYPGLGSLPGKLGWTSVGQLKDEQAQATREMNQVYARFASFSGEQLAADPQAHAIGERLFINNCSACHGSDAKGSKGFPNLTDTDWLYGGSFDKIVETVTLGRQGNMPPMASAVGTPEDVHNVANYVLSLSGSPHDAVAAQLGKTKFVVCAACHGAEGKGNQTLGAPNLTDKIWLHGWGEEAITAMVNKGKLNVMPAQQGRLTPDQIRVVASYVWGLSNNPSAPR